MAISLLTLLMACALLVCATVAIAGWARRDDPTVRAFLLLAIGAGVWCGGRMMEIQATNLADRILWAKLQYPGILMVPVGWLLSVVRLTRPNHVAGHAWLALALVIGLAGMGLVLTNESHRLIWSSIQWFGGEGLHTRAVFRHGPAYWVLAAYSYALLVSSFYFLLTRRPAGKLSVRGRNLLVAGLMLPLAANAAYLQGWTAALGGDLTPATFSVMALLVWVCALRPHLGDVGHYARLRVFDALREGCVIVDDSGRIADLNSSARRMLPGLRRGDPAPGSWQAGRPNAADTPDYELTMEPVRNLDDRVIGRIVFVRDISAFRTREHALVEENSSLAVRLNETADKLSRIEGDLYRDPLTGLFNRRFFQREAALLVAAARERRSPLGLLLVDVDFFKQYNDVYGHLRGDEGLRRVGITLAQMLDEAGSFCARIGGEEFAVVLPEADAAQARAVGMRMLHAVRALQMPHVGADPSHPFLTVSIGAVSRVPESPLIEDLLSAADMALYAAKRGGRNRLTMADGQPQPPARPASMRPLA
ncbi:histidine kinase N-terminal 7TM domain-containing protein [Cupriavidus sp. AU9028]|uniref:histidine kinase N-terminal 7TM domain-containing protein n=1 Tax=Cupriavidus sp. AU9028 TaxID=2871157 RepID=UPI001C94A68D|nr:histidine kinase N-terminal 7TM domain-containing protein [Cupriavidus sp. AU9028]MBY4895867.1 diguanylate cyclase [Cupriavidus sp. AU9028]